MPVQSTQPTLRDLSGSRVRSSQAETVRADGKAVTAAAPGRVILVGAGPGDADLLTVRACRAIAEADVILTDFLVGDGVLDHASPEAEIISVGKAKGRHSKTQAEINALIVAHAREGKTVVRLKGGDPFMFGRGGEEVDIVRASGLACEVVPGITAATAAAASLQIPLTHRDLSRTVTFLSGHGAGDGRADFSDLDLAALASGRATLAVYMGVSTAPVLAGQLLAAGWSPATPVMIVENASRANEKRTGTTLDVLAKEPERLMFASPAVLLIGEVAGLSANGHVTYVAAQRGSAGKAPVDETRHPRDGQRAMSALSIALTELSHA
jgi:uroporphyrin-III C-methyltransferase